MSQIILQDYERSIHDLSFGHISRGFYEIGEIAKAGLETVSNSNISTRNCFSEGRLNSEEIRKLRMNLIRQAERHGLSSIS
jgi:hypothetical protein